jgi:hypothetical protein
VQDNVKPFVLFLSPGWIVPAGEEAKAPVGIQKGGFAAVG